jgi:hypothetical protein
LQARAHTSEFWAIFHGLLEKAEAKKIYRDVFQGSPELDRLTGIIREKFLLENGGIVKEMGRHLLKAHDLCASLGIRFEDYVDRVLRIPRAAANVAIKMHQYDLDPAVGADNMRFLAGIRNGEDREAAEKALLGGKSPDTVKTAFRSKNAEEDPGGDSVRLRLEKEKIRLERTIESLSKRLDDVKKELAGQDRSYASSPKNLFEFSQSRAASSSSSISSMSARKAAVRGRYLGMLRLPR